MYEVSRYAADFVVQAATDKAAELEALAKSASMRGQEHVRGRKLLRDRAHDLRCVAAGMNTGEGVTRAEAKS